MIVHVAAGIAVAGEVRLRGHRDPRRRIDGPAGLAKAVVSLEAGKQPSEQKTSRRESDSSVTLKSTL
jgi:hypothetical protein